MVIRRALLSAVSLLSVIAACDDDADGGDTHACTLVGCQSVVVVEVPSMHLQPGRYELRAEYEDVMIECTFRVEQPTSDDDAGAALVQSIPGPSCEQPTGGHAVQFGQDGDRLVLNVFDTPESLRVRVIREGETLSDDRLKPEYETHQPNGPDCEPTCRSAMVSLAPP